MVRVVVDTNVLVSAFLKDSKPRKLLVTLLESHELVSSAPLLAELADVLSREKFGVSADAVERFIAILVRRATVVQAGSDLKVVAEDPDDDVVLSTAVNGKAEYIVSGDKHLLKIDKFKNIRIVTVGEFIMIIA